MHIYGSGVKDLWKVVNFWQFLSCPHGPGAQKFTIYVPPCSRGISYPLSVELEEWLPRS
jgi:hypothetical protein